MSTRRSFLDLPGEVRNLIYAYAFVRADPIKVSDKYHGLPLSLLRTNKTIHQESQSVFYGQNSFDFTDISDKRTPSLLDKIGQENAKWISSLQIVFPTIRQRGEDVEIDSISARVLDKVHNYCPNLDKLTLGPGTTISGDEFKKSYFSCPGEIHTRILRVIATRLVAISLLLDVTLKLYKGRDCVHLGEFIDDYGWKISYVGHPFSDGFDDIPDPDWDYEPGYFEPAYEEPDYDDDEFYPSGDGYDDE